MVLTDLIAKNQPDIEMFSLDTGRLPQETYDLMQEVGQHYSVPLKVYFPDSAAVEEYVAQHGSNGFYDSVEAVKACCFARKVEPLRRALKGKGAWVTGLRRDQAVTRGSLEMSALDADYGLQKFNPLLEWSNKDVWAYIRQIRRALQQTARPVLPQHRLRALHPLHHARRGYPCRQVVVGGPRRTRNAACMRAALH